MAQLTQTTSEFIQNTFCPMVAVICSHDAEVLAQKNNLSFVEMTKPFSSLSAEAHLRDPSGMVHPVKNFKLMFSDVTKQQLSPPVVKKQVSDIVGNTQPAVREGSQGPVISVGTYDLQLSLQTPWFEAYREFFLQNMATLDHEFLRHHIACMLVVSTAHADPMDQFSQLSQQQHQLQHNGNSQFPKWLCPNIFKYYVLLHDNNDGEEEKADAVYQSMKSTYGLHACHLLRINSRDPEASEVRGLNSEESLPNPWMQYIKEHSEIMETPEVETAHVSEEDAFPNQVMESDLQNGEQKLHTVSTPDELDSISPEDVVMVDIQSPTEEIMSHPLADGPQPLPDPVPSNTHKENNISKKEENIKGQITKISDKQESNNVKKVPVKKRVPGVCLTLSDHDRLRIFVHEFVVRGLLPYMERMIRSLHEQLQNRKGLHRSFMSATKKWFGGNRQENRIPMTQNQAAPKYLRESPELQMRRLADLAFLVQMYELAYTSYHTAKRDFSNDQAWLHYAGALEMAALSAYMHGNLQKAYPVSYMETACSTYADTCKQMNFASRNVMLHTEVLKAMKKYNEAAMDFIRMTGEDSDLRSALFLEQASLCFIAMPKPMVRKYAFHMILAGHRYSKASQRKHALRCYCQALQVYKGKGWSLAEDHINFTIGRQSLNLRQLENATAAFRHVLTRESHQPAAQQGAFLREYLFVYKQLLNQQVDEGITPPGLPQLPLPLINKSATRVLLGPKSRPQYADKTSVSAVTFDCILDQTEMAEWQFLEEQAVLASTNETSLPAQFRPTVQLFHGKTNNNFNPLAVVGEPITVELILENPLKVPVRLSGVKLLWKFVPVSYESSSQPSIDQKQQVISSEPPLNPEQDKELDKVAKTEVLAEMVLNGSEYKLIHLSVEPYQTGELCIRGLSYGLSSFQPQSAIPLQEPGNKETPGIKRPTLFASSVVTVQGMQELDIQGPRLNNSKLERCSVMYGPDRRLDPIVVPKMPLLEVSFSNFPSTLLCGEISLTLVELRNQGPQGLTKLHIASDHPELFTFGSKNFQNDATNDKSSNNLQVNEANNVFRTCSVDNCSTKETIISPCNVSNVTNIELPNGVLEPGDSITIPMWIRGPDVTGIHDMKMLFCYESSEENLKMRHRTLHHNITIHAANSVSLSASVHRAHGSENVALKSSDLQLQVHLAIENMNQLHDSSITEVSVEQVSCVSSRWSLQPVAQPSDNVRICGGESLRLDFKARQLSEYSERALLQKTVAFTDCCFGKVMVESTSTPCVDFCIRSFPGQGMKPIHREGSLPNLLEPRMSQVDLAKLSAKEKLESSLAAHMMIVVIWKAFVVDSEGESHAVVGQNHIVLDSLDQEVTTHPLHKKPVDQPQLKFVKEVEPSTNLEASEKVMSQLVHYSLQFPTTVEHNFNKSVLCSVPVELDMFNCCNCDLEVFIETTPSENSPDDPYTSDPSAMYLTPGSSSFSWTNLAAQSLTIPALKRATTQLRACFGMPGVYNLSNIQLMVRSPVLSSDEQKEEVDLMGQRTGFFQQKCLPTSMITIMGST